MVRIRTNEAAFGSNDRIAAIRLGSLFLRQRRAWAELFGSDDAATIMISLAIIRSERILRDPDRLGTKSFKTPITAGELSPANVSSIAEASGMNRETARRKVAELLRAGKLIEHEGGLQFELGLTQQPAFASAVRDILENVRNASNYLLQVGIFEVEP